MSKMHYFSNKFSKSLSMPGGQPLNLRYGDLKCVIWRNFGFSNGLWQNQL